MHEYSEFVINILIAENRVLGEKSQCHFSTTNLTRCSEKKNIKRIILKKVADELCENVDRIQLIY